MYKKILCITAVSFFAMNVEAGGLLPRLFGFGQDEGYSDLILPDDSWIEDVRRREKRLSEEQRREDQRREKQQREDQRREDQRREEQWREDQRREEKLRAEQHRKERLLQIEEKRITEERMNAQIARVLGPEAARRLGLIPKRSEATVVGDGWARLFGCTLGCGSSLTMRHDYAPEAEIPRVVAYRVATGSQAEAARVVADRVVAGSQAEAAVSLSSVTTSIVMEHNALQERLRLKLAVTADHADDLPEKDWDYGDLPLQVDHREGHVRADGMRAWLDAHLAGTVLESGIRSKIEQAAMEARGRTWEDIASTLSKYTVADIIENLSVIFAPADDDPREAIGAAGAGVASEDLSGISRGPTGGRIPPSLGAGRGAMDPAGDA